MTDLNSYFFLVGLRLRLRLNLLNNKYLPTNIAAATSLVVEPTYASCQFFGH
jgi:hypothetical protein